MYQIIKKAFTLIELLVVIAIIGILSGLIVVAMGGMTQKANIAKAQVFSNSLRNSLMMDIMGEWKFDELTTAVDGTAIRDSWKGINNGVLDINSIAADTANKVKTGTDCVSGNCLILDGTDDYINCGTDSSMSSSSYTLSTWFKTTAISPNNTTGQRIITIFRATDSSKITLYMKDSKPALLWILSDNSNADEISTGITSNDNAWHNLVGSTDGANFKVYLDGTLKNSKTSTMSTLFLETKIGIFSATTGFFSGSIDDVRIYGAIMPASQIREQYFTGINNLFNNGSITAEEYKERINSIASNE